MGLDLSLAERLGSQWILPPPAGVTYLEFVVGRDGEHVAFVEFTPSAVTTAAALTAAFGTWRQAPAGPHQDAPTLLFDGPQPDAAPRGCSVLARVSPGWPQRDLVEGVVLHPRPYHAG